MTTANELQTRNFYSSLAIPSAARNNMFSLEERFEILKTYFQSQWSKNHLFGRSAFPSRRICEQAKLPDLGFGTATRNRRETNASSKSHSLVWILEWWHNWPIFLRKWGNAVTVNGERYRAMLTNFLWPKIDAMNVDDLWFQQDGATCHTSRLTIDLLRIPFKNVPIDGPPCIFFFFSGPC